MPACLPHYTTISCAFGRIDTYYLLFPILLLCLCPIIPTRDVPSLTPCLPIAFYLQFCFYSPPATTQFCPTHLPPICHWEGDLQPRPFYPSLPHMNPTWSTYRLPHAPAVPSPRFLCLCLPHCILLPPHLPGYYHHYPLPPCPSAFFPTPHAFWLDR